MCGRSTKVLPTPPDQPPNDVATRHRMPDEPSGGARWLHRKLSNVLEQLLLSPDPSQNIFCVELSALIKLRKSHHIACPPKLTIRSGHHSIISHLISGACTGLCQSPGDASSKHKCLCVQTVGTFDSPQFMSFNVVSTLLSASADRFPDTHAMLVAESLGLSDTSQSRLFQHLN
jgi:hypothetical protein